MTCDDAKPMLAGYADGELSALENDAIAAHLAQCGRCRQIIRDQQRIQHVLDSHQPPAVDDARWNEIGKRLRAELEGQGEPIQLKTRSRIEGLDPTPEAQAPLAPDEPSAPARPAREVPAPTARPRAMPAARQAPAMTVIRVRPRRGRAPFRWVAHLVGAVAAALIIGLGLATLWTRTPPLDAGALARQDDVAIMGLEMLDPDHNLVLLGGDAGDVAAIWVEPDKSSG
ncbi:MAG TPA: zf-HC2 domain-containing protein [Phycisphaerae bacterium]|nr:zf-HC2 domain-containing protein [Phycisphaerae bacterium]